MSNTCLICQGFTSAAFLAIGEYGEYSKISNTSFSCSMRNVILQSSGAWANAESVTKVRRMKGPFIHDVPVVDLSISFELGRELLKSLIEIFGQNEYDGESQRNSPFRVKLTDHATSMEWEWKECYATKFSFNVSENTILSVSMDFFVVIDHIFYEWKKIKNNKFGEDNDLPVTTFKSSPEKAVIPYYDWSFRYKDSPIYDVIGFSFSFSQSVEPKYECCGGKKKFAPVAKSLLFGSPTCDLSMTIFKGGSGGKIEYIENYIKNTDNIENYIENTENIENSVSDEGETETFHSTIDSMKEDEIIFSLRDPSSKKRNLIDLFSLTGCVEISSTPEWDTFPCVERSYEINGQFISLVKWE